MNPADATPTAVDIPVKCPKKLIEVALPLDDINVASAREKSIRHGHPSTLHLWWARRPLAAARAVLFAQLVNDPGYERHLGRGVNKEEAGKERERLFGIIRRLVQWENTNNEEVLQEAREEIRKSWRETCHLNRDHPRAAELFNPEKLPAFHDPFAGGGTIPLEAQRLGLEAYASDLNPVAVLINKAMIEIPPKFAGRPPVNPEARQDQGLFEKEWRGAQGLAEDVRYYGRWMRDEAEKRIGHLYPKVEITPEMAQERPDLRPLVGQKLTVIAWLWARTVKSPNPAFAHVEVPLVSNFTLAAKEGKEAWVKPVVDGDRYRFTVKMGKPLQGEDPKNGTKAGMRGADFLCMMSGTPIDGKYIKAEGQAGRLGQRLMAIVAEGVNARVYLDPTPSAEALALEAKPHWQPELEFFEQALGFRVGNYGLKKWSDLYTKRQLLALATFSDLVGEARDKAHQDALTTKGIDDGPSLEEGGNGASAYADAVAVYLAFGVDRSADFWSTLATWSWQPKNELVGHTFGRQALPMTWDFGEINVFSDSGGNFVKNLEFCAKAVETLPTIGTGAVTQLDATRLVTTAGIFSTDPPYYDNVGYADLSDYFYVWLRHSLKGTLPKLCSTLASPKEEELVATPGRHGGKEAAELFFLEGMKRTFRRLEEQAHPSFPVTIYYAFKAIETEDGTSNSTGWGTFLEAVTLAGFTVCGTWPVRTERSGRLRDNDSNALASSIVLVCRKRNPDASAISRREFIRELNAALPEALADMIRGTDRSPVAPVDLSQAIIGPGMAIFSKYSAVLEGDGTPMSVRTALQLINRFLAEDDFDADTQFCLHWFDGNGWSEGKFGEADVLARAKGTSVDGVTSSGVIKSGQGSVRLLRYAEYPGDWSPLADTRLPVWEALHQLIRALQTGGESAAGLLVAEMPGRMDAIRQLAYRLYTLCERKGWADDARAYNELIASWQGIESESRKSGRVTEQLNLFEA